MEDDRNYYLAYSINCYRIYHTGIYA